MNAESGSLSQQVILDNLRPNDASPYRRIIRRVNWLPPERFPYLFHTSSRELGSVDPVFCQSFDYKLFDRVVPVTYVLPFPHVNRVKRVSEVWSPNKSEGFSMSGLPYTYLRVPKNGKDYGQIRMGSTMLDQYLLAAENSGMVFSVHLTEISKHGLRSNLKEVISLGALPVIDACQFLYPSPIGLGTGGIETHLEDDIYRPEATGYQSLLEYVDGLPKSPHRTAVIDLANKLTSLSPEQVTHRVFGGIVEENRQAFMRAAQSGNRLLLNLNH